jgi:site-specific recombinase XerD
VGLADSTIAGEVIHLEQVRGWLGKPLWEMQPADADSYFGQVLRGAARGTRLARAQALKTYFLFLELRHKVEIHQMTGHVVACPVDELNRPRGGRGAALRIPPSAVQVGVLFAGWRGDLAGCRKFAPAARNYTAARLMADVGLRVNEVCQLDLADVKWDLGRFGKIHVRMGKGARGSGPRERMVPLINNARAALEWFVRDVWCCFDDDHARAGAPLLPSERKNPTAPAPASGMRRSGRRWPMPPPPTCRIGRERSRRTCCGTSAPAAVCTRHGPDRHPGDPRAFLDRHHDELHPRPPHPCRGCLDRGAAARRAEAGGAVIVIAGSPPHLVNRSER